MANNFIWVYFQGQKRTLYEIAKIMDMPYSTIYQRYRSGKKLDDDKFITSPLTDRVDIQIERRAKHCSDCGELKSFNEFHRNIASRDNCHTVCKQCRGIKAYQKMLEQRRLFGPNSNMVKNCERCDLLFAAPRFNIKLCKRCRND